MERYGSLEEAEAQVCLLSHELRQAERERDEALKEIEVLRNFMIGARDSLVLGLGYGIVKELTESATDGETNR